ncbi:MAG TPA: carboxypeptidase-like regulatory domain-containing protein [Tepidisphaeraceae bacterium]|nr:carboxypeptidase-like regulatory domain-containing protein [Tepidisphaeraceae bacterium]
MHRMVKWMAPVVAIGLLVGVSATRAADDAAKTGTVSGTVMGTDGKPAENVTVRLMKPHVKADPAADKTAAAPEKPVPVATATTDDKGKFEMKDVPVGDYNVAAGSRKVGMAHDKVSVTADAAADVSLTLKAGDTGGKKKKKHAADAGATDTK